MPNESYFKERLNQLKVDGNYRVFTDLARHRGAFPAATRHSGVARHDVTVWCSNDYLGMGPAPGCAVGDA